MAIEELTALVTPPESPTSIPDLPDWTSVESELGIELPEDYKHFVLAYGSGLLANFFRVFNPFDKDDEYMPLVPSVRRVSSDRRDQRERQGEKEVAYPVYPDHPGILTWGNDDNGNELYWLTTGRPDEWPCILGEGRAHLWEQFDLPMTTFLAKALKGEIKSTIWPDDFPNPPDCFAFESF